jgi:hypothetical protein
LNFLPHFFGIRDSELFRYDYGMESTRSRQLSLRTLIAVATSCFLASNIVAIPIALSLPDDSKWQRVGMMYSFYGQLLSATVFGLLVWLHVHSKPTPQPPEPPQRHPLD